MMVGGLFASLGMILASFATSIIHIYFCTGVITGRVTTYIHIERNMLLGYLYTF